MSPGSSVGRETNPTRSGYCLNGLEDIAAAVSDGPAVLVCPVIHVVMEELVEDVSYAPQGQLGLDGFVL